MPTKLNVKVNTIQHTTQTSNAGNELNYVEITGYDATNSKGFKKRCFATRKDGTATKNAETADSLVQDDWVEISLDDTSYHNIMSIKKIAQPAGLQAPSQADAPKPDNKKGGYTKKGEFRTVPQLNREVSLKAAVAWLDPVENGPDDVIYIATRFEEYLVGKPVAPPSVVDGERRETVPNGNTIVNPTPEGGPVDEEIPF